MNPLQRLAEFLRARIEEEQASNRHAEWERPEWCDWSDGKHLDCNEMKAELDAKLKIVELAEGFLKEHEDHSQSLFVNRAVDAVYFNILTFMVMPYREHPDCPLQFREGDNEHEHS